MFNNEIDSIIPKKVFIEPIGLKKAKQPIEVGNEFLDQVAPKKKKLEKPKANKKIKIKTSDSFDKTQNIASIASVLISESQTMGAVDLVEDRVDSKPEAAAMLAVQDSSDDNLKQALNEGKISRERGDMVGTDFYDTNYNKKLAEMKEELRAETRSLFFRLYNESGRSNISTTPSTLYSPGNTW